MDELVAVLHDLIQILSRQPGDGVKETVDSGLVMVGVESRREDPSVNTGLYLIEVGQIGEIKANALALPKQRKDILKLPADMDDHVQYKFGFSKHLNTLMIQHENNELKNTRVVRTWTWPASAGMLVDGENCIRDSMKNLGGHLLAHTTDWPIIPPKYEEVIGDVVTYNVHRYLNREHQVELTRLNAQLQVTKVQHQVIKLQLEIDKLKLELQNSDLYHENNRYNKSY